MRKLLKILGWVVGTLVVVIGIGAVVMVSKSNAALAKNYSVTVKPVQIPADAGAIERGLHLAKSRGCTECHGADLGGAQVVNDGAMGVWWGANLTKGKGGRTAQFKDDDWIRAIRHGVGPDGRGLFLMPSEEYAHLSDADLGAVIAYAKSVPAVDRDRVPIQLGPIARVLVGTGKMKLAAEVIDHPNLKPPTVTPGVTVEYGKYLSVGCIGCHGPNFSGGKIEIGPPDWPPAANLTPHADSHLPKWTEADFITTVRTAKRPDGKELNIAMPRAFGNMDDTELKALWLFLKSLPPVATGVR